MSRVRKQFALFVTGRELATILAALRFHQDENLRTGRDIPDRIIKDIATDCGSLKPLNFDEVGRLCERINTCDEAYPPRDQRSTIMNDAKEQINIARIIYDAYPHADLLPIDADRDCRSLQTLLARVTAENIGDSLFTFMVVEVIEGGESTVSGAIRVLEQARADVQAVLQALRDADANLTIRKPPIQE